MRIASFVALTGEFLGHLILLFVGVLFFLFQDPVNSRLDFWIGVFIVIYSLVRLIVLAAQLYAAARSSRITTTSTMVM
jgi:hypothetical protein